MSTATRDPAMPTQEEIANFQMPQVGRGTKVLYYPPYTLNEREVQIAFVQRCDQRSAYLVLPGAHEPDRDCVPHREDPRLRKNADCRAEGAWVLADDAQMLLDLQDHVSQLQATVKKLETELKALKK